MHRTPEGTTPAERGSGGPQAGRLIDHSAESKLSRTRQWDEELSRKVGKHAPALCVLRLGSFPLQWFILILKILGIVGYIRQEVSHF